MVDDSGALSYQYCLADRSINARVLDIFYRKNWIPSLPVRIEVHAHHKAKIKDFLTLEVLFHVPFLSGILELADTVQVTKDLLRAMLEKQTLNQVFVIIQRRNIWRLRDSNRLPLHPLYKATQIGYSNCKLNAVAFVNWLNGLSVTFSLLLILMDPCFAPGCVACSMVSFAAFLFVESVFRPVNLTVTKELVLGCDCVGHSGSLEQFEKFAVGDHFALKYAVKSKAFFAAKRNRLGP